VKGKYASNSTKNTSAKSLVYKLNNRITMEEVNSQLFNLSIQD